jgi:cytochrome c peroxidase
VENGILALQFQTFTDGQGNVLIAGGDCFDCHGDITYLTDNLFHNNGLDIVPKDPGLMGVTGKQSDNGRFKTPTLRNIEHTAPYMHDGRFPDLDSVLLFYSFHLQPSPNIDRLMKNVGDSGVQLDSTQRAQLKAFLLTFSDPDYYDPNN